MVVSLRTLRRREVERRTEVFISENRISEQERIRTGEGGFKEDAPLLRKQGAPGILTDKEKRRIVKHMKDMNIQDMSMKEESVMHFIIKLVKEVPRQAGTQADIWAKQWIKDGCGNKRWYTYFIAWVLLEYPDLKRRKEDPLDKIRADVTRPQINTLYEKIKELCVKYLLIRNKSSHWWNTDETNIRPDGNRGTVLLWKHLRRAKTILNVIRRATRTTLSPTFRWLDFSARSSTSWAPPRRSTWATWATNSKGQPAPTTAAWSCECIIFQRERRHFAVGEPKRSTPSGTLPGRGRRSTSPRGTRSLKSSLRRNS